MENLTVACTVNRRMQEEFRRKERVLERQQSRLLSRLGRERSELFDKLIQLNVRTPHAGTRPSESEQVKLARVELDTRLTPPKSLSLVLGRTVRRMPRYVTPLLEQRGSDVFCELQEDKETRRKLEPDTRTNSHLYKTANIARCLEAIRDGTKMADFPPSQGQREDVRLTRSKTFSHCMDDKPSFMINRNRERTYHGFQNVRKQIPEKQVNHSEAVNASIHRLETAARHQQVRDLDTSTPPGLETESSEKTLNSSENLVYFNLSCRRVSPHKQPETDNNAVPKSRRQSLLKGYVPYRGIPGSVGRGTITLNKTDRQKTRK